MAGNAETLTPEAAVRALREIGNYEESITMRTAGLTWMVWALAVPGIFLTYGSAHDWIEARGVEALFSVLWAPWIVLASAASAALWRTQAVTLRKEQPVGLSDWLAPVGFTLLFFAIAGVLLFVVDVDFDTSVTMALVTGLFTMALAVVHRLMWGAPPAPTLVAGALIAAAATGLGLAGVEGAPGFLLGAALPGTVYFALGLLLYRRG